MLQGREEATGTHEQSLQVSDSRCIVTSSQVEKSHQLSLEMVSLGSSFPSECLLKWHLRSMLRTQLLFSLIADIMVKIMSS